MSNKIQSRKTYKLVADTMSPIDVIAYNSEKSLAARTKYTHSERSRLSLSLSIVASNYRGNNKREARAN